MDSMGCDLCDNLMLTKIEPSVVIVFVSRWREYFSRKLTEDIRGLARYVDGSVPRSCELFMALGSGIIGTRNKVPCEIEECDGISSIMIPRSTEVSVTTFFLTLKALKAAARNTAEFKTSFSSSQISNAKLIILNACANAGVVKKAVKVLVKVGCWCFFHYNFTVSFSLHGWTCSVSSRHDYPLANSFMVATSHSISSHSSKAGDFSTI